MILDAHIRPALIQECASRYGAEAYILEELGIRQGRVRIDVAVIDDHLRGFEIKSDADGYQRLPQQVQTYSEVLDFATVVVTGKRAQRIKKRVPEWWGVWVVRTNETGVYIEVERPGERNPAPCQRARCESLWRSEAMRLLKERGAAKGTSRFNCHRLWSRCTEVFTPEETRLQVLAFLKLRGAQS